MPAAVPVSSTLVLKTWLAVAVTLGAGGLARWPTFGSRGSRQRAALVTSVVITKYSWVIFFGVYMLSLTRNPQLRHLLFERESATTTSVVQPSGMGASTGESLPHH
jgi:hypothetical protein